MVTTLLFVGSCTRPLPYYATANGKGIAAFRFDERTGSATPAALTSGIDNPTFLAIDPEGATLYATSEVMDWNEGTATAYTIDPQSGGLAYINKQPTRGSIAAQMSFDRTGRFLLTANYGAGPTTQRPNRSLVVFPRRADGELGAPVAEATHTGRGPDSVRQERPHAHCVMATPDNCFLVVADLGLDSLVVYRFDAASGAIVLHGEAALPPGAGPRHFVFHPTLPRVYLVNELSSTVASLAFDAATASFDLLAMVPTVREAVRARNHCSEIRVAPNGRDLYVGNRGHDSVSRFVIDPKTGVASLIDTISSRGKTPRHFAFDPSGRFLAVANQDSDCIALFSIDPANGALTPLPQLITTGTPTAVAFVRIDRAPNGERSAKFEGVT
jgi:6-phosphogluconolactonase